MNDLGIQKPFFQKIETTSPQAKNYFSVRKLFTDYLTKLNVPFYDTCCPALSGTSFPVRWNGAQLESFDGTTWNVIDTGGDVPEPLAFGDGNFTGTLTVGSNATISAASQNTDINISGQISRHFPNRQAHNSSPIVPVAASYNAGY